MLSTLTASIGPLRLTQLGTRSPSSSRTYRSAAPTDPTAPSPAVEHLEYVPREELKPPSKHTSREKAFSRGKRQMVNHVVEQDISMTMRRRVIEGYSISEVRRQPSKLFVFVVK
jgi:hypothetical protein